MLSRLLLIGIILLVVQIQQSGSHWWLSSQVFTVGSNGGCNNIAGLAKEQKTLCRKYPTMMEVVGQGAKLGLQECQHQFATSKWNCSHLDQRNKGLLGLLTSKGNREAAFFQAITSAGVVYKVTRACNSNKYGSICTCDMRHGEAYPAQTNNANTNNNNNRPSKNNRKSQQPFKWTYCNDNIKFGMNFAQRFLDAREVGNDARVLMNKQNNLAGRAIVESLMTLECTCHGVSGACNLKTCRNSLPSFYRVGDYLQQQYHGAIFVTLDQVRNILTPRNLGVKEHMPKDLVYLEESPDYCEVNVKEGTLGVAGRRCNRKSPGPDGCLVMCCGMGHHTKKVWIESNCNCTFIWCCKVKCQKCRSLVEQHFCRGKKKRRKNKKRRKHKNRAFNSVQKDPKRRSKTKHIALNGQRNI